MHLYRRGIRYFILFLLVYAFGAFSCTGNRLSEEEMSDPTTTYSTVRTDSNSGIEIIGDSGNNPLKVRENIRNYVIPESSFIAKRAKLYSLLNRLEKYTHTDTVDYGEVDSLNYLSIHYLKNLLQDPQNLHSEIRHRMLHLCISSDKCLSIYSWNENISPKYKSFINVYQYRKKGHAPKVAFNEESYPHDACDFQSGKIDKITHLYANGDTCDFYLVQFSGNQGADHLFKGVGCVEIDTDSICFNRLVFNAQHPSISLHYTKEGSASITYNSKKRCLQLLRITPKQGKIDTLTRNYTYNGSQFTLIE